MGALRVGIQGLRVEECRGLGVWEFWVWGVRVVYLLKDDHLEVHLR